MFLGILVPMYQLFVAFKRALILVRDLKVKLPVGKALKLRDFFKINILKAFIN